MRCYHCKSKDLWQLENTVLGYPQFKCKDCLRKFNERTGTDFNRLQYRTEIVFLAIYYYVRLGHSLRQVSHMLLERGIDASHQEVNRWLQRFSPMLTQHLKKNTIKKIEKNLVC